MVAGSVMWEALLWTRSYRIPGVHAMPSSTLKTLTKKKFLFLNPHANPNYQTTHGLGFVNRHRILAISHHQHLIPDFKSLRLWVFGSITVSQQAGAVSCQARCKEGTNSEAYSCENHGPATALWDFSAGGPFVWFPLFRAAGETQPP